MPTKSPTSQLPQLPEGLEVSSKTASQLPNFPASRRVFLRGIPFSELLKGILPSGSWEVIRYIYKIYIYYIYLHYENSFPNRSGSCGKLVVA
jgi:hypothetical protein